MTLTGDAPVELLTAQDERRLARAIEVGVLAEHLLSTGERPVPATDAELEQLAADGHRCWQHFLLANVRLVWKLAGPQARRSGLPREDLFQEGFVALAGALQRFDPGRGRFSTYATRRIERHLTEVASSRLGELALPRTRAVQLQRARALAMALTQENGRAVSLAELAAGLDQTPEWTRRLVAHRAPVSLDAVAGVLVDSNQPEPEERVFREQVRQLLDRLPADQAELVRSRFGLAGEPLSLLAAAQRQRVSLSSAKRLERSALVALRAMIEAPRAAS